MVMNGTPPTEADRGTVSITSFFNRSSIQLLFFSSDNFGGSPESTAKPKTSHHPGGHNEGVGCEGLGRDLPHGDPQLDVQGGEGEDDVPEVLQTIEGH